MVNNYYQRLLSKVIYQSRARGLRERGGTYFSYITIKAISRKPVEDRKLGEGKPSTLNTGEQSLRVPEILIPECGSDGLT